MRRGASLRAARKLKRQNENIRAPALDLLTREPALQAPGSVALPRDFTNEIILAHRGRIESSRSNFSGRGS